MSLGGNAIIATDIDYSEVGSSRGMLMVCASGTAIILKNTEILGEETKDKILSLNELQTQRNEALSLENNISKLLIEEKFLTN